ncbi:MAG: Efflux ABC transporter, permease/ATP-binding protein, partial [uncultured Acetobacteraceae bacterium]
APSRPFLARRLASRRPLLAQRGARAGAPPPGGGGGAEPVAGRHERADQLLEPRILQLHAGARRGGLLRPAPVGPAGNGERPHAGLRLHRRRLHRGRGVRPLPPAGLADPLAALAHARVPRRLAGRPRLLPHRAGGRRHGQPGPAHRRGPPHVRGRDAGPRPRPDALRRHPVQLHPGALGPVRAARRFRRHGPRLHGLGGAALRGGRHVADAPHRPAADRPQLRPAAGGGGLPLRPGAPPRQRGGGGAPRRRSGREARPAGPLRRPGGQLVGDHGGHQAPDDLHQRLRAGGHRVPLPRRGAPLLQRRHPARRPDPDGDGLLPGAGRAVLVRGPLLQHRRVAGHGAAAHRLPGRRGRGAGRRGGRGRPARGAHGRAGVGARRRHPGAAGRAGAAGGRGRADRAGRGRPHHRDVGQRQIHPVPRGGRHLALRPRPGAPARGRAGAVPAAAALSPARHPAPRPLLPGGRSRGPGRGGAGGAARRRPRPPRTPPGRGGRLGPPAFGRRAAAGGAGPRPAAEARLAVPGRSHGEPRPGRGGRLLHPPARKAAGGHHGLHRAPPRGGAIPRARAAAARPAAGGSASV